MSSLAKSVSASSSPVVTSRPGTSARQVSSTFGAVSEVYAQTGVKGDEDNRGFDDLGQGGQHGQNPSHEQPQTLKLHGTSRNFAMLFETTEDQSSSFDDGGFLDDGRSTSAKPAFQAYMMKATSTYDSSTRAINGENRNRGGSLNIAF